MQKKKSSPRKRERRATTSDDFLVGKQLFPLKLMLYILASRIECRADYFNTYFLIKECGSKDIVLPGTCTYCTPEKTKHSPKTPTGYVQKQYLRLQKYSHATLPHQHKMKIIIIVFILITPSSTALGKIFLLLLRRMTKRLLSPVTEPIRQAQILFTLHAPAYLVRLPNSKCPR